MASRALRASNEPEAGASSERDLLSRLDQVMEAGRLGARARTKREVSDRLRSSALELFYEHGYDEVTVGDIAERAGLTSRTFFRYFPTKETVIVDITDQTNSRLIDLLETGNTGDPILEFLERVLVTWFGEYADIFRLIRRMGSTSESLLAALLLRQVHWEKQISAALGDVYPHRSRIACDVWATLFFGLMRLADDMTFETGVPYTESVAEVFEAYAIERRSV